MASQEKVRRYVSYKPNAQVLSFFRDLKQRKVTPPSGEAVTVSSRPIPKSEPLKPASKKKASKSGSATKPSSRKNTKKVSKPKPKKKKGVDKRLQRVKL